MGLDTVELVMRCEEEFNFQLEDWRLGQMRTVGDLLELICEQLHLPFGQNAPSPKAVLDIPLALTPTGGWTRDTVWSKLVAICVDQLQIKPEEVMYTARFGPDLGVD
jgi:hypothetical protein